MFPLLPEEGWHAQRDGVVGACPGWHAQRDGVVGACPGWRDGPAADYDLTLAALSPAHCAA
jgi:hypothetical protein